MCSRVTKGRARTRARQTRRARARAKTKTRRTSKTSTKRRRRRRNSLPDEQVFACVKDDPSDVYQTLVFSDSSPELGLEVYKNNNDHNNNLLLKCLIVPT